MKCYDWRRELAHRFDPARPPLGDWLEAREHLDGCSSCRREALAIDPTLAFRDAGSWSPDTEESESIRLAVRALRRTQRLREGAAGGDSRRDERRRIRRRVAAAASFAVALALLPGVVDRDGARRLEIAAADPGLSALRGALPVAGPSLGPLAPAIEGLDRPQARVYEWGAEDLSVVMVVDESLDV